MIMKWMVVLSSIVLFYLFAPALSANPSNTVVVPDVTGIKADKAKTKLELKGFQVEVIYGAPAPSEDEAFKVYEQSAKPFLRVERGQKIILTAFEGFNFQPSKKIVPRKEGESEDLLESLFGVIDDFQKKDENKKRLDNEQNNETSGHSIRGDERPPEMKKPKSD